MEGNNDAHRPSRRAAERLTDGVGRELGAFRASLTDAMAEADRLEQEGRTDLAVDLLEEQRLELARVYEQVIGHIAAAAVESEAESIMAAVEPVSIPELATQLSLEDSPDAVADRTGAPATGLDIVAFGFESEPAATGLDRRTLAGRVLASAMAAVLGVVLFVAGEPDSGQISIASQPRPTQDVPVAGTSAEADTQDTSEASTAEPTAAATGGASLAGRPHDPTRAATESDATSLAGTATSGIAGTPAVPETPDAPAEMGILDGQVPTFPLGLPDDSGVPTEDPSDDPSDEPSDDPSGEPSQAPSGDAGDVDEVATQPSPPSLQGVEQSPVPFPRDANRR